MTPDASVVAVVVTWNRHDLLLEVLSALRSQTLPVSRVVVVDRVGVESGPLAWAASLDLAYVGFGIIGLFLAAWIAAVAVWRLGRIEERWERSAYGGRSSWGATPSG